MAASAGVAGWRLTPAEPANGPRDPEDAPAGQEQRRHRNPGAVHHLMDAHALIRKLQHGHRAHARPPPPPPPPPVFSPSSSSSRSWPASRPKPRPKPYPAATVASGITVRPSRSWAGPTTVLALATSITRVTDRGSSPNQGASSSGPVMTSASTFAARRCTERAPRYSSRSSPQLPGRSHPPPSPVRAGRRRGPG